MRTRSSPSWFQPWVPGLCLGLACLLLAPASARRSDPQEISFRTEVGEVGLVVLEEHVGPGGAEILCRVPDRPGMWAGHVFLHHRVQGMGSYQRVALEPRGLSDRRAESDSASGLRWGAVIPHQPRGTRVEYFIELAIGPDERITIPPLAPAREAWDPRPYTLTFKGRVSRPLLIAHVLCMVGGMVPLGVGLVAAFAYLFRRRGLALMRRSVLIAFVLLFLGGVPLGMPVEWQVFGTYWEGWPFGRDVTDSKTGLLLLLWLVLLLVRGRDLFGRRPAFRRPTDRTWAGWVIALVIFTVALYLIPHENIKF
ncbi:MAG: hypothetical protein KAY32_00465 [Candidatus Eisenbacteria sp.]|nr:hypothetical protein [Candidatus Eisenbacteria bacterium]